MSKRDGGHPNWNRCIYCGLFIAFTDFYNATASTHFTPDKAFSSERLEAYHNKCRGKSRTELREQATHD